MKSEERDAHLVDKLLVILSLDALSRSNDSSSVSAGSGDVGITWIKIKGSSFMMGGSVSVMVELSMSYPQVFHGVQERGDDRAVPTLCEC